jgi:hypothetical protein
MKRKTKTKKKERGRRQKEEGGRRRKKEGEGERRRLPFCCQIPRKYWDQKRKSERKESNSYNVYNFHFSRVVIIGHLLQPGLNI